jgi:hypothetical protein
MLGLSLGFKNWIATAVEVIGTQKKKIAYFSNCLFWPRVEVPHHDQQQSRSFFFLLL